MEWGLTWGPKLLFCALLVGALPSMAEAHSPAQQEGIDDLEAERKHADLDRRRGRLRKALSTLEELGQEFPEDAQTHRLLALCRLESGDLEGALASADTALEQAAEARTEDRAAALRTCMELDLLIGQVADAEQFLTAEGESLDPEGDPRDAWLVGRIWRVKGELDRAREAFLLGAQSTASKSWEVLLAKARCERTLGRLERASETLVEADRIARAEEGSEPDVLVELGTLYFEADGEVDHPEASPRSPARLLREAVNLNPVHEGALVALFELHRFNWHRNIHAGRRIDSPYEILDDLLRANPRSIPGLLAAATADLEDGLLPSARERLESLRALCPKRREVRTLEAALAWIEHRREESMELLGALAAENERDAAPEREVGRILFELYRFDEGVPFLRRAVERDPKDAQAWTQLGRGLANTGDEQEGLNALVQAGQLAQGRQDPWRHNTTLVLKRMQSGYREQREGDLTFVLKPDSAEVLSTYLVPFYRAAREELAARYGFTSRPVRIEVFREFADFSVRSTGYEGFPALGVCFGPVVTAVSPLSELRGTFSWARTAFHEFTHVIHLGLSHNRCPRWITEGLATWEETRKSLAWDRNMRRELVDAYRNEDLIPLRELNRAFRGPRILFGYYQGGLLCQMLIDRYGFAPMIRLLEAFDEGLDLDGAFAQVFDLTPEEVDRDFLTFIGTVVEPLKIEPAWQPARIASLRLRLRKDPPKEPEQLARWSEDWCTLAWGSWQQGKSVDAEQALRVLASAGAAELPRALFLRGHLAHARGDIDEAKELWQRGFDAGGEEFFTRMARGTLAVGEEDWERAESDFLAAERDFPGFDSKLGSAELALGQVYSSTEREEERHRAHERWLAYNADDYALRLEVARWHALNQRPAEASRLFEEAMQVDPFRRGLHREWGEALRAMSRHEEALREFRVAQKVPPELDADEPGPLEAKEHAELIGLEALCLLGLERAEEALERARAAIELDPDCATAREVLDRAP
jgi:tetratricopeptide (TPR) repeat protein